MAPDFTHFSRYLTSERGLALIKAEEAFNLWMDIYPESERCPEALKAQKSHDQFMDY